MCGPHHSLERDVFGSGPEILRRLLQLRQSALVLEQGWGGFSPVQRTGVISSRAILGGLHHVARHSAVAIRFRRTRCRSGLLVHCGKTAFKTIPICQTYKICQSEDLHESQLELLDRIRVMCLCSRGSACEAGCVEVYPGPAALLALFERSLLRK